MLRLAFYVCWFGVLLLADDRSFRLFNGKNLEGWYWSKAANPPAPSWAVRDGLLVTTPKSGTEVYLISKDSFTDFDFRFEWRAERGGNSGIKYRIQALVDSGRRLEPVGLEYQITDDVENPDALSTPRHSAGALYDYAVPNKTQPARAGVWHRGRIVARGLHIEHWLDDVCVVRIDLDSADAATQFEQSDRKSRHMLRRQEKRLSPLALQIHDGVVEFRNLELRRLE